MIVYDFEIQESIRQQIKEIMEQGFSEEKAIEILCSDVIEYDNDGNVVGWGSDKDYDRHGWDVVDGYGYYDENGHYVAYKWYD